MTAFDTAWSLLKNWGYAQEIYNALLEWEDTPHMEELRHAWHDREEEMEAYTAQHHADRYVQGAMEELGLEGDIISVGANDPDSSPSQPGQRQKFHYTMPDGSPLGLSVMEERDFDPDFGWNRTMSIFGSPVEGL